MTNLLHDPLGHEDRPSMQISNPPRKIFATLDATARDLNLMFNPDLRDFYCEQAPHAFSPVPGGWGHRGTTHCDLEAVDEATLKSALMAAHQLARPKVRRT